ncbi:MAG: hypothetical protein AAF639_15315 [Chloroflexota bacterium]
MEPCKKQVRWLAFIDSRVLDTLIYIVDENESHPLASLMDIISVLIERYEDVHVRELADL